MKKRTLRRLKRALKQRSKKSSRFINIAEARRASEHYAALENRS